MEKVVPKLRFPEFNGDWEEKKLGDITSWASGGTPPKDNPIFWDGDIPWISASSMRGIEYSDSELKITNEGLKKGSKLAKKGALLILVRGSMLFNKIPIGIVLKDVAFNQDVKSIVVDYSSNSKYILQWFIACETRILNMVTGTGIGAGKLDLQDLKSLKIEIPSFTEQQKIASFLTSVDERLALLAQQKEKLELYKKGVMQQIFSQKLRFKDENGNEYPDWEEKNFNEIIERTSTGLNPRQNFTLGKGNNYYVTIKNISNGKLDFRSCEMIDDDALKLIKKRSDLSKNDIIMSSIGNIGEAYLLKEEPTNWNINESVFMIRSKKEVVMPLFMYYILSNDYTKRYFENNMTGSSFKSIKIGDLKLMPVEIPCLEEQQKIASFLSTIDVQIEGVSKKIEQTKLFKKGLLQQMFV